MNYPAVPSSLRRFKLYFPNALYIKIPFNKLFARNL